VDGGEIRTQDRLVIKILILYEKTIFIQKLKFLDEFIIIVLETSTSFNSTQLFVISCKFFIERAAKFFKFST
jgi:hypothetical protein